MSDVFRILVICSGNRCRSPFAESYLARALAGLPVEVSSAGTLDVGPADVPSEMATIAASVGLDLSAHRARPLASIRGTDADLIIGMERHHVAAAVVDGGMPADKTFGLVELARLLDPQPFVAIEEPAERARTVVAEAAARRSSGGRFMLGDSVTDPFGRSKKTYRRVATQIGDLCDTIVGALFGVSSPSDG